MMKGGDQGSLLFFPSLNSHDSKGRRERERKREREHFGFFFRSMSVRRELFSQFPTRASHESCCASEYTQKESHVFFFFFFFWPR